MKAHIGVNAESGLVHTVRGLPGNISDTAETNSLLHGQEGVAFGDAHYKSNANSDSRRCATSALKKKTAQVASFLDCLICEWFATN